MINKNEAIKNNIKVVDNSIKNELFENLKTNFPQTIIEGKADLKAISLLLGLDKKSDISGYELTWTGKGLSNALYSSPCNKELKLEEIFSNADCKNLNSSNIEMKDSNNPKNIIIRGDNLDVLKILKSAYSEKIKMIYIDPPYNTTNENFIYPDNFRQDYKKILEEVGLIEIDENGEEVESEDLKFFKNIQGSRTHSGWLSFMLPRLKLARDLLKEDGVIFISIDDNEQANLKLLCDEILGEDNFVSCFVWQKKSGGGQAKYFYEGHEYILIYCKNKDLLQGLFKIKEKGKIETDFLRKIHGKYTNNLKLKNVYEKYPNQLIEHRNLMFEEMDIFLQEKLITQEKYDEIKQNLTNGIYFLKPYNDKFHLVCRNNENNQALMYSIISGVWTSDGNTENEELFGQLVFNDPKPINLLKQLIQSVTMQGNSNDIILDFFAGSGTTAQAVMELNAEDKGNREFILVQIDEEIKEDKSKSAYDFCKKELKS
ncbi:site-specific DNA-methyltransferase [Brachyspira aalborgi]|uniref:site-specific DNA-methyltransferase n=1 Tax=Brachyspira aalborgi TaxID=29522 RepID=UPI00039A5018|nr:site-specific DNA-methyltransferase [Brachyspira aalborgi]